MSWKIDVKMNTPKDISKRLGIDIDGRATRFLRDTVDRFSDPYIPMGAGVLKNNKRYPSNHEIQYVSPQAHYQYTGVLMLAKNGSSWAKKGEKKHYTGTKLNFQGAPKRGANWDKRMWADRKNDILKDLENFVKRGGK